MALLVPGGGCARLAISHPAQVSRRTAVVATLSPPKLDKVDYWVDATSSFFEPDSRPIMLYDGVCNLCNGGVKRIRYEALQSESGKKLLRRSGRAPDDISSVVLVEKDRFVRDFAYDNIANNRYNIFGRSDSCELYDK
ncbi:DCC family protein [Citrus sinensis]|uniref:DCC family protein n=1 Tax=Citrus sinensis TaxID=2711 RepID=A0ACB8JDS1_CITSI|nr:DCC family protein [Citrus sinensis]